jgi:hypothetical protein
MYLCPSCYTPVLEGPEGVKWWDLPNFGLGEWDLDYWDSEWKTQKTGIPTYHYKNSCSWTFEYEITFNNSYKTIFDREYVLKSP